MAKKYFAVHETCLVKNSSRAAASGERPVTREPGGRVREGWEAAWEVGEAETGTHSVIKHCALYGTAIKQFPPSPSQPSPHPLFAY